MLVVMDAKTLLAVRLSAVMGRNQYTTTPEPVIVELQGLAGPHVEVLACEAGTWVGYHRSPETEVLCAALLELPGAAGWGWGLRGGVGRTTESTRPRISSYRFRVFSNTAPVTTKRTPSRSPKANERGFTVTTGCVRGGASSSRCASSEPPRSV